MKTVTPEFSRPLIVAKVSKLGSHEKLSATPGECRALAKRLGIPTVHGLTAKLHVKPWRGGGFTVKGEAEADIDQQSVVSLETFRSTCTFAVERYFLPHLTAADDDADIDEIINRFGRVSLGNRGP
jgi:hypothetical protein